MKIKLDRPIEHTISSNNRNMSIGNKDLADSNQRGNSNYMKINSVSNNTKIEELNSTPRVDRVESSKKVEKTNSDYSSIVKQRNEKLNQYRKELINRTTTETDAKSNVKREQAKQELVAKLSSSSDNIKRVQQEFNNNKEQLTSKIQEQNDSTVQAQAKLRESKRQLLVEIQKTSDANTQIQQDLQQNQRELTSKNVQEISILETNDASNKKTTSIDERKAELVKKVIDNTSEDATIKQKLAQYKRELANATAERQQLTQQTKEVDIELEEYSNQNEIIKIAPTTSELDKIRDTIKEQEVNKNITELLVLNLDTQVSDLENDLVDIDVKIDLPKITKSTTIEQPTIIETTKKEVSKPKVKVETPKNKTSNVTSFNSQVISTDDYQARNLTAVDVSLLSNTSAMNSYSNNVTDISAEISTNYSSGSSSSISTTSIDAEKQAIISKIAVDTSETTEIQQKLREYQAEVRKINSEILSLSDDVTSTTGLVKRNYDEADEIDSFNLYSEEVDLETFELIQVEQLLEAVSDIQEVEVMMSTQEELNSAIKLIATEIKQDELLAKIAEQEQAIARNKILEKREGLIELAKQNNELLRTLNQRLAIITKKAVRKVVYTPTIITQRNRMIA